MTLAVGLAIGYFAFQYLKGNIKMTLHGRIHRSASDRRLAGVCGGIAEWLGVDPTMVRLAWLILVLGWGTGLLLYAALALALPVENSSAQ